MYIYGWVNPDGQMLYIIATLTDHGKQYIAPLSAEGQEATGLPALIAATLDELGASPHVPKFLSLEAAKRALPAAKRVKLD
jgi:hypothetical protein